MPAVKPTRLARRWGSWACVWCVVFAVLHVYWAVGGTVGLASSAGRELAARRPVAFVLLGLWGTAVLLLVGALLGAELARRRPRRGLRKVLQLAGWSVAAALLLRGVGIELLLVTGVVGVRSSVGSSEAHWSLLLWNPWFIVGGVAFGLAARQSQRSEARPVDNNEAASRGDR